MFRLDLQSQEAGKASSQWNDNRSVTCRSSQAADQRVAREEMTRRAEGSPGRGRMSEGFCHFSKGVVAYLDTNRG